MSEKPPIGLGLMPRREWLWQRGRDIVAAMARYVEAEEDVPLPWADELRLIIIELERSKP